MHDHRLLGKLALIRDALRERVAVSDEEFDQLYPVPVRSMSDVHRSPVSVALRASALLAPEAGLRVLDVGSGCGKLCCIGALASDATWNGIESNPRLVGTALAIAHVLGVDRQVRFTCGDMTTIDWADFDSLYLFNPFEAGLFLGEPFKLELAFARYLESVTETEVRLADLPTGTRVVTYHGFGGTMPGT